MFEALALDTMSIRQINKQSTIITTHKDFLQICVRSKFITKNILTMKYILQLIVLPKFSSSVFQERSFLTCTYPQLSCTNSQKLIPVDTKTSQKRRKNVLFLVSKAPQIGLKWKSRQPFSKTSSRRLQGDVLKTSPKNRPQDLLKDVLRNLQDFFC